MDGDSITNLMQYVHKPGNIHVFINNYLFYN